MPLPRSQYGASCPIIRVPIVSGAAPKKFIRCPECDKKWPIDSVGPDSSSSEASQASCASTLRLRRRPSPAPPRARRSPLGRPGGFPSPGRHYPPKHDCSNHGHEARDPRDELGRPGYSAATAPPNHCTKPIHRNALVAPTDTYALLKPKEDEDEEDLRRQGSTQWEEPCCSRRPSVWGKIKRLFRRRERGPLAAAVAIAADGGPGGRARGRRRRNRHGRKGSSVTWSRTSSVIYAS